MKQKETTLNSADTALARAKNQGASASRHVHSAVVLYGVNIGAGYFSITQTIEAASSSA